MRKRRRYQAGSVVISPDGKHWLGQYRENGIKKTKTLGKRKGSERISKANAETKLADIVQPLNSVELQDWLDGLFTSKDPSQRMAHNTVDHLRWDLKAIFDLAVADGIFARNPIFSGKMLLYVHPDWRR